MTLPIRTDRQLVRPDVHSVRYLTVHLSAPDSPERSDRVERLPLDIALVIDASGSMAGNKLALAKEAALRFVAGLTARDRVALVAFDTTVQTLAPSALCDVEHRRRVIGAIDRIEAGSQTNLSGGWLTGCEAIARAISESSIARCLLLSDGQANEGITEHAQLEAHARELRARGIVTSTFGIGEGYDERLMEGLARSGGGNFYYIDDASRIPEILASELGEALEVIARNVELVVDAPLGMEITSLDDRHTRVDGGRVRIALNDVVARLETELVLRVRFPQAATGAELSLRASLTDTDSVLRGYAGSVSWRVASHEANDSQPRDVIVDRAVAVRYAAQARREAAEFNRMGDLRAAREVLLATAKRVRDYAFGDAELLAVIDELERLANEHRRRFEGRELKRERMTAYADRESKLFDGSRPRRSP
jgi:Ca-activated chloride channel family protein